MVEGCIGTYASLYYRQHWRATAPMLEKDKSIMFFYYLFEWSWPLAYIAWSGLIKDVKITEDQWWNALTEIACKLYGGGPKENKIWTEADGEEYDLLTVGTGKELWIAALKKLRNGGCHGITVDKLLKKMMKEHKRNEDLKTINDLKNKI